MGVPVDITDSQVQRGKFQPSTVWVWLFFSTILAESGKFYKCQDLLFLIFNLGSIQGLCKLHLYTEYIRDDGFLWK